MTLSEERALENERMFRDANEQIERRRDELAIESRTPYLCECEDRGCTELIRLTPDEYSEVRSHPDRFMIANGHPTRGSVDEDRDGYVIVAKGDM